MGCDLSSGAGTSLRREEGETIFFYFSGCTRMYFTKLG